MKGTLTRLLPTYIEMHKEQAEVIELTVSTPLSSNEEKWALIQEIKELTK